MTSRYVPTLREVSNLNFDAKSRGVPAPVTAEARHSGALSSRSSTSSRGSYSLPASPAVDRKHRKQPAHCTEMVHEVTEMFYRREKKMARDSRYLANQTEINEKMRMILVDWLVDVHMKFRLHGETLFLAADLIDRYLAVSKTTRSQLQLVGITCLLLAAKYEEIWPPEIRDCIQISANTYTRDEMLRMERAVTAALQFKLTVPTPFPFLARLLEVSDADDQTRHMAFFFMEHSALDYKCLSFMPSQLAHASLFLANVALNRVDPWSQVLQHYSKARVEDFRLCAEQLLAFTNATMSTKYQAIRRKYSSTKCSEVAKIVLPREL